MSDFVLASASPRRKELMRLIAEDFRVVVSDADESAIDKAALPPSIYVQELALLKASASAKKVLKDKKAIIIGADTIVVSNGEIMGKPADDGGAFDMLRALSGKTHEVYTGFCIMRVRDAYTVCDCVKTEVTFRDLSDEKIRAYIKTGEPRDKAGAYGIQGKGSMLIKKISGDYFNVVGFPISEIAAVLEKDFNIDTI
ncbi:MAG: Maf family protein [Firmicutes bacterium]|nr:Maf family protein [Bacillota bacterium]